MFDRYGVFGYLPSDVMLDALINIIQECNNDWQTALNIVFPIPRSLRNLMVYYSYLLVNLKSSRLRLISEQNPQYPLGQLHL